MSIAAAIKEILKTDSAITAIVGETIRPGDHFDDGDTMPGLLYNVPGGAAVLDAAGVDATTDGVFEVECWVNEGDYPTLDALAAAVKRRLEGFSGMAANVPIQGIWMETRPDGFFDDAAKRQCISFEFDVVFES